MIKKHALLLLTAPFLMVFSDDALSDNQDDLEASFGISSSDYQDVLDSFNGSPEDNHCRWITLSTGGISSKMRYDRARERVAAHDKPTVVVNRGRDPDRNDNYFYTVHALKCTTSADIQEVGEKYIPDNAAYNLTRDDSFCSNSDGSSYTTNNSSIVNYLSSGGSVRTNGGACSVSSSGVAVCDSASPPNCSFSIESVSTGELVKPDVGVQGGLNPSSPPDLDPLTPPDYLTPLPGACSDNSSCFSIGDQSYLVDWDSAPDYFEYVGSDGNTYSNPNSGGDNGGDTGGGDPTDPTNPTDPTDPGGNDGGDSGGSDGGNDSGDGSGGSSGGGSSGGGSTVPDFEFDESGIIEAIGSAGQSNRNAINALSNDVTSSINNQTNELNNATSAQTDALSGALSNQTDTLSNSLDSQTDTITGALNDQTGTLSGSLDALGTSIVDAINAFGSGEGEGESDGEGTEEDGLLDGISNLFNGLVDDLASRFTEDLGNGDDLFNSSGLDNTLDNVAAEEQEYTDEINTLMDEIGDGATSGIAEQVTSRLPSLPSGGCTPLQFGPMEISCQAFNTIKLWLTWIVYFWTVVSIVDIFFRSEQRTA